MENKSLISIIAVNWHAEDFTKFLIHTAIQKYSKNPDDLEVIIIDNSGELKEDVPEFYSLTRIIKPGSNLGHGKGMDLGIKEARGKYILALDIDSHILMQDWDKKLIEAYEKDKELKLIGAVGGLLKPMRPAVMFFERKWFIDNNMSFKARDFDGAKFDVGIHFYFKTLSLEKKVSFLKWKKTDYKDCIGEEYTLNGERAFFHLWYATRWYNVDGEKVHDVIDGIKYEDFLKSKDNLFKQI